MGKNLIQQRRGKGSIRFRTPVNRFIARASHKKLDELEKTSAKGQVIDIVHCPAHSAPLMEVAFESGDKIFTIAPEHLRVGDTIESGNSAPMEQGHTLPLRNIPEGTTIFNIEAMPGDGGKFARSAGGSAKIVGKTERSILVELPSKKQKEFNPACRATVGRAAGTGRLEKPLMKAGASHFKMSAKNRYWPNVRGQAMNAVAHPHGGKRKSKKNYPYTVSRDTPPGAKVGLISSRRTGKRR